MKGDKWTCHKCGDSILEGDVPYIEAVCRRTIECRRGGGVSMRKEKHDDSSANKHS